MEWNISLPEAEWYVPGDPRLAAVIREVVNEDIVSIDTETTGLSIFRDVPLYWSLAWGERRRIAMPITTLPYFQQAFDDPTKAWVFANAKFDAHMLAQRNVQLAGHWYDVAVMHALLYEEASHKLKDMAKSCLGWSWRDFFDVFKRQQVPDYNKPAKILKGGRISQPTRPETNHEMFIRVEKDNLYELVDYASNDAYGTLALFRHLRKELEETNTFSLYSNWIHTMADLFFYTEAPFTKVLWKMERNGFYVEKNYLTGIGGPMGVDIEHLRREMQRLWSEKRNQMIEWWATLALEARAGWLAQGRTDPNETDASFNPNSTEQLRIYFIEWVGLKPLMMTKGGKSGIKQASVDKKFLEHYEQEDEMASLMGEHRELSKLKGTYIDNVDDFRDNNGRIHTKYNQDVARTGRLSSSDPNIQNIPQPDKDKFKLRGAFRPQPGADTCLIVGDYSALEMRLLACATVTTAMPRGEEKMIQLFLDGKDIHMGNAATVFGPIYKERYGWELTYDFLKESKKLDGQVKEGKAPKDALTERHVLALLARNQIKSATFGMVYGMKAGKLGRQLGIPKEAAQAIVDAFNATYPAVDSYFNETIDTARNYGVSFTLLGRRRVHSSINSPNNLDRWGEERKATNNGVQGTAADVVRMAMLAIDSARLDLKYGCHMILQVHDELGFECQTSTAEAAKEEIRYLMENALPLDPQGRRLIVPLEVSIGTGERWDVCK
jgi:DNA polymerase I-like protein with 3'-5' exonuclease and polymerase domains